MNQEVLLKYLYSLISKTLLNQTDIIKENFEKADKIIIWIVGFSIGIFVLIISPKSKSEFINGLSFEISVFSLTIVILGLLYRIISFFTQMHYTEIVLSFATFSESFSGSLEIPISREINKSDSAEDIIKFLQEDFKEKIDDKDISRMPTKDKENYRALLIDFYNTLADSNDIERQLNKFKTNFSNHFGYSKKHIDNLINNEKNIKRKGIIYRILIWSSYIFFFLTIGTFILGVSIILQQLITNNYS